MTQQLKTRQVEDSLKAYESIQSRHLQSIRTEAVPDLARMTQERDKAFQVLKNHLDSVMQATGSGMEDDNINELNRYKNWISTILELDEKIAVEIKKYKDTLKSSINTIQQGKTAMNGYRLGGSPFSRQPRVLSMNR